MSYSTGTADSRATLLNLFKDFAVTSGWSVNRFVSGVEISLQKTGTYGDVICASLTQINPGIYISMSDSYDAAKAWNTQPGNPTDTTNPAYHFHTSIGALNAVAKYWFFSGTAPEFIAMVVLLPNNTFQHLLFGEIQKTDFTVNKGAFMYGTNGFTGVNSDNMLPFRTSNGNVAFGGTSWIRLEADEQNGWRTACRKTDGAINFNTEGSVVGAGYIDDILLYNSLNTFSNSAALSPINLYMRSQIGDFSLIGHVPLWRIGRRTAFIVDQIYPLGTDEWMAFPVYAINGTYSFVYRKVS